MNRRLNDLGLPFRAADGLGHIYVLLFINGTVKVGNTTNPDERLRKHFSDAAAFGIELSSLWVSPAHEGYLSSERRLVEATAQLGGSRHRKEYFRGVDYSTVRDIAAAIASKTVRELARTAWALAENGNRDGAVQAMQLAGPSRADAEMLIDQYMDVLKNDPEGISA